MLILPCSCVGGKGRANLAAYQSFQAFYVSLFSESKSLPLGGNVSVLRKQHREEKSKEVTL